MGEGARLIEFYSFAVHISVFRQLFLCGRAQLKTSTDLPLWIKFQIESGTCARRPHGNSRRMRVFVADAPTTFRCRSPTSLRLSSIVNRPILSSSSRSAPLGMPEGCVLWKLTCPPERGVVSRELFITNQSSSFNGLKIGLWRLIQWRTQKVSEFFRLLALATSKFNRWFVEEKFV